MTPCHPYQQCLYNRTRKNICTHPIHPSLLPFLILIWLALDCIARNALVLLSCLLFETIQCRFLEIPQTLFGIGTVDENGEFVNDLFQPKTDLFSTHALISVKFKTVRYFSQSIFSLFSYLKIHNTIQLLNFVVCYLFSKPFHSYLLTSRTVLQLLNY